MALIQVVWFLLALVFGVPYVSAQTSGAHSTLHSSPEVGTVTGNTTNRQVTIVARTSGGAATGTGGDIFAVSLFPASSVCDTNAATPACTVSCSPSASPNSISPSCVSTTSPPSTAVAQAHWVDGNVTDNGDGTYLVFYEPQIKGSYNMTVELLTVGGLRGVYYDNVWFLAPAALSRVDATLNFQWGQGAITTYGVDYVSVRWSGKLRADYSESFTIFALADDGVRVWLDRQKIIDKWDTCCNETWATVSLVKNHYHDVIVEYRELQGTASIALRWSSVSVPKQVIPSTNLYYTTGISGSPFPVTIRAGDPPYPNTTTAAGAGLSSGNTDTAATFNVTARDIFNNQQSLESSAVWSLLVSGPDASPVSSVTFQGNGSYTASYSVTKSGTYSLSVLVNGNHIKSSPFVATIAPGATNVSQSVAFGPGTTNAVAGITSSFTIQAKDANGNNQTTSTDSFTVILSSGANSVLGTATHVSGSTGQYTVAYTISVSGTYNLAITMGGVHVSNSPLSVVAIPGAIHGPSCTAVGTASAAAVANGTATFVVQSRDKFSNLLTAGGSTFVAQLTGPETISGTVVDLTNGHYNISYTANLPGTYQLAVTLGGIHISGSPFALVVTVGAFSAGRSTATGGGLSAAVSGVAATFTIQSRDVTSNALSVDSSLTWSVSLTCTGSVSGTVTYCNNGQYCVTYTPTEVGSCSLAVTESSVNIVGSPFTVAVVPGVAAASTTTAVGSGVASGTAGALTSFLIYARDINSNIVTQADSTLSGFLQGGAAGDANLTITVTNLLNGSYHATYTPVRAGALKTHVHLTVVGGLTGRYYSDELLSSSALVLTRKDATVNFTWGTAAPVSGLPSDFFSVSWEGQIKTLYTETHVFFIALSANSGVRLYVNNTLVIDKWDPAVGSSEPFGSITLVKNTLVPIVLTFRDSTGTASVQLYWQSPSITKTLVPSTALYVFNNISGSPFTTTIATAAGSNSTTTIHSTAPATPSTNPAALSSTVSALASLTSGVASSLTIQPRDVYGNLLTATGQQSSYSVQLLTLDTSTLVSAAVTDAGSGRYSASWTPTVTGAARLSVLYNGAHVVGSPVTTTVVAGAVSAAHCTATGSGLTNATVNIPTNFTIQARDAANNTLSTGGLTFSVVIAQTVGGSTTPVPVIVDRGDGTYFVSYTITSTGSYSITVTLSSVAIKGSAFTVAAIAGVAYAANCFVYPLKYTGKLPNGTNFNEVQNIVITAVDIQHNYLLSGGDSWHVTIDNHRGTIVRPTIGDDLNGNYTVNYTLATGTYTLTVELASDASGNAGVTGLTGAYYNNAWLQGSAVLSRVDNLVNFNWGTDLITPTASQYVSVRWTGFLKGPSTEMTLTLYLDFDTGARLYVDDLLLIDSWTTGGSSSYSIHFPTRNALHSLVLEYKHNTGAAFCVFSWDIGAGKVVVPSASLFPAATAIQSFPRVLYVN